VFDVQMFAKRSITEYLRMLRAYVGELSAKRNRSAESVTIFIHHSQNKPLASEPFSQLTFLNYSHLHYNVFERGCEAILEEITTTGTNTKCTNHISRSN